MEREEDRGRAGAPVGNADGHPASIWATGAAETQYAKSEDGYVAYQVFGRGAHDLLFIGNWASNLEAMWEHPSMARFLDRLGQFARVICSTSEVLASRTPWPWARCRRWSTGWTTRALSWTLPAPRRPPWLGMPKVDPWP